MKSLIQSQLSVFHTYLIWSFLLILMMRCQHQWRQSAISWYKFIKIRIIASAADHKIWYHWGDRTAWSQWIIWILKDSYQCLRRNWNTMTDKIWLCMNTLIWLSCIFQMSLSERQCFWKCILRDLYTSSSQSEEEHEESFMSLMTYHTKVMY